LGIISNFLLAVNKINRIDCFHIRSILTKVFQSAIVAIGNFG
jgi:hypothetical protein